MSMSEQIREYVRLYGWAAALSHPVIGLYVRRMRAEQRDFQNKIDK